MVSLQRMCIADYVLVSNSQIGATNGAVLSSRPLMGWCAIGCSQTRGPFFQNEPNFRSSVGWPQADPRFGATNASGSATRTFPPISSSNTLTRPLSSNRSRCPTTSAKGPRGYTDGFTLFQVEVETDAAVWIGRTDEALYHPRGDRLRLFSQGASSGRLALPSL